MMSQPPSSSLFPSLFPSLPLPYPLPRFTAVPPSIDLHLSPPYTTGAKLSWAACPPIPGYAEALGKANTAFRSSFKARDQGRVESILKLDKFTKSTFDPLSKPRKIEKFDRERVKKWLNTFAGVEMRYKSLNTTPLPFYNNLHARFFSVLQKWDLLTVEDWAQLDPLERDRAHAIQQGITELEKQRQEYAEDNNSDDSGFQSFSFSRAANAKADNDDEAPVTAADILGEEDMGVNPFFGLDSWELVELMRDELPRVKTDTRVDAAHVARFAKEDAHARQND
jgi:hypothetical protein